MADLETALAHHRAGRIELAKAGYEDVLHRDPGQADALHMLGVISAGQGDPNRGIALIQEALSKKPHFPMALNNLGLVLIGVGRVAEAVDAFEQAAGMRPEDFDIRMNLAGALRRQGRLDAAIGSYRKAVSARPDAAKAQLLLAHALSDAGKLDEAVAAYWNLAQALRDLERLEEAEKACRRAVEIRPGFTQARRELGELLLRLDRHSEGLEELRKADGMIEFSANAAAPFRLV